MTERLDKILAHQGLGSRKDVKKYLRTGAVCLNGKPVYDPAAHVDLQKDILTIEGSPLKAQGHLYLMMNKAPDCVCSTKEGQRATVFDYIDEETKSTRSGSLLHTMGRLDADTTGLLLLTSDGELTHRLISPKNHIPKTYAVRLRDSVSDSDRALYAQRLQAGIEVPPEGHEAGFVSESAILAWSSKEAGFDCELTVTEGKFHEVKRLFSALGNEVTALKRISFAGLALDPSLKSGSYRSLTEEEIELLKNC